MNSAISRNYLLNKVFILTIVVLVPLFDSATGYLVNTGYLSEGGLGTPSQLIRFFIILLSILIIQSKWGYTVIFLASLYLFTVELFAFVFHQSFQGLFIGLVFAYKFIFSGFVYFALKKIFKDFSYSEKDIIHLVVKAALVLCVSFLIGDLIAIRVGISSSFFRSSGLFSSGNGLGVLLGVFSIIMLYGFEKFYFSSVIHKYIYVLILVCLFLISTKASVVFLTINLTFQLIRLSLIYKLVVFCLVGSILLVFKQPIIDFINIAFELTIYRYENMTSWANFILSAREDYITDAMESFNNSEFKILRIVFGAGSFLSYELPSNYSLRYKMMEMDSFDTFFMYGIIGLIVYISAMYYCVKRALIKSLTLAIATIALFLHSIFAGHTMYNGLAATGIVFILLLIQCKENVQKKSATYSQ